jgi:hypothetical protein
MHLLLAVAVAVGHVMAVAVAQAHLLKLLTSSFRLLHQLLLSLVLAAPELRELLELHMWVLEVRLPHLNLDQMD